MKKLFIIFTAFSFLACSKVANNDRAPISSRPFFKDASEAFTKVSSGIKKIHSDEELKTIDRISYLYSGVKSYALVFYTSNKRSHHLVIERDYSKSTQLTESYITCDGDGCNCEAVATVGNDGTLKLGCSCPTCDKVIVSTFDSE